MMSAGAAAEGRVIETEIPARLDRLPWARWHWMVLASSTSPAARA